MPSGKDQGKAMTPQSAANIQSSQAKSGGDMTSGGFAARAQAAGARNENTGYSSFGHSQTGNQTGGQNPNSGSNQTKK